MKKIAGLILVLTLVQTSTAQAVNRYTGFLGATNSQLVAQGYFVNHRCAAPRACWGATVANTVDGVGPRLYAVIWNRGRVQEYDERIPNTNDVATALAWIKGDLPKDVVFGSLRIAQAPSGRCGYLTGSSKTLARTLGPSDPGGRVFIEFSYTNAQSLTLVFNPKDVQDALIGAMTWAGC
jgi:hypothetical protein